MENLDNFVKKHTSWLDDPYVSGFLIVFLIVYASMAAPKLPNYIANLFDNTFFKLFIFFLIVYVSKRNATVALVAAVALMVSIMALQRIKVGEEMMAVVTGEGKKRIRMGNCVCECDDVSDMPENQIKTEEGQLVLQEAKKLEAENVLHPSHVKAIAEEIVHAEKRGEPVLAARTEEGAKHLHEIAKAETNGTVSEQEAKKLVAKIVAHEIAVGTAVVREEHNMLAHTDLKSEIHASADHAAVHPDNESSMSPIHGETKLVRPENLQTHQDKRMARAEREMVKQELPHHLLEEDSKTSMAEMAREVLKRKQEETERHGVEPTGEELRRICAGVLSEYRNQSPCGANCARKDDGRVSMVEDNDESALSFGHVDHH